MTTLQLRIALTGTGDDLLPQPYVCEQLDAALRVGADVYVGRTLPSPRHREAWWRKMREAGLETYHRHGDSPVSTRLPVLHPWTAAVRLDADPATQVLGPHFSGRRLQRARDRGVTSIVAADLAAEAGSEVGTRAPAYHPEQVVVAHRGTQWIVVVPAPGVVVQAHGHEPTDAVLVVDLGLRAARGCDGAPAVARRLPRHVGHAARAAR